jgi:ribosomal protein S18 acetylase RimI-like enzyme
VTIRDYRDQDEASWLRCRVLAFLSSAYYDDVKSERTRFDGEAIRLVAVHAKPAGMTTPGADEVVGIIDVELFSAAEGGPAEPSQQAGGSAEPSATIDTIAVHPDHARAGIAGALLEEALERLRGTGTTTLDAWTREDEAANDWYRKHHFAEQFAYLHVHKAWDDPDEGFTSPEGLSAPVTAFLHGRLEDEEALRRQFRRAYRCRQYLRRIG